MKKWTSRSIDWIMEMATAIRELKRRLPAGGMVAGAMVIGCVRRRIWYLANAGGTRHLAEERPGLGGVEEGAEACDFGGYILGKWGTMSGTDEVGIEVQTA
jgi:hypothetical protein